MREIEAFLAVADELHFGRAAQRLHVTTARVSQAVRTLEGRAGALLFERTSRQVSLTPLGERLLAGFRPGYERLRDGLLAAQQAGRLPEAEVLRVGFATSLPRDLPGRVIENFEAKTAGCRIARTDQSVTDLLRWFDKGELDPDAFLGWLPDPDAAPHPVPAWVRVGPPFGRAPRGAVMSVRHPLAGRSALDIEELAGHDVVRPHGYAPFIDAWTPPVSPGGRPMRLVPLQRHYYPEDYPDLLGHADLIHLFRFPLPEMWAGSGLVAVPITGLPPVACATFWPQTSQNPWITTFAEAAAAAERT